MRAAPPVSLSCPRRGVWLVLLVALPALAVGIGAAWALQLAGSSSAWAVTPVVLAAVLGWRSAPRAPVRLAWDGQQWLADGEPGELAPMLDLQAAMLLRWQAAGGGRHTLWLPVSRHAAGPAWHALRVAVHARRPQPEAPTLHV